MRPFSKTHLASIFTTTNAGIWLVCAIVVTLSGPFGTYDSQTIGPRLLYWSLVIVSSSILGNAFSLIAKSLVGESNPIRCDLVTTALMAVVFSPLLWVLTHFVLKRAAPVDPTLWELVFWVILVTAAICATRRFLPGFERVGYGGTDPTEYPSGPPRLVRRLPSDFTGLILRLTVRDHFVDVVTSEAVHTIRLRFADAIAEMDTVIGYCTHRSHWVARSAIERVEREGGRIHLRISNGDLVPVSRTYKPELEAAGVLSD